MAEAAVVAAVDAADAAPDAAAVEEPAAWAPGVGSGEEVADMPIAPFVLFEPRCAPRALRTVRAGKIAIDAVDAVGRYAAASPMVAPTRPTSICLAALLLSACAAPRGTDAAGAERPRTESDRPAMGAGTRATDTGLVAIVDGRAVNFAELRPSLVEAAGETALRDRVVDLRLAEWLKREGLAVDAAAIARERTLLLETLDPDPARAEELLREIRLRQRLGTARYDALLARNAGLRALVAPSVRVDDEGLANAFDMLHGPKRTVRIAVLATLADAEAFARELATRPFIDLAVERSLDESAARGGLLAPLARRDPSYPEALRAAAYATAVGATSAPVLDGARFYLVTVLSETPADGTTPDAARAKCERMLRLSRERLLMDALARELGASAGVTVFDRSFDRGFDAPTPATGR